VTLSTNTFSNEKAPFVARRTFFGLFTLNLVALSLPVLLWIVYLYFEIINRQLHGLAVSDNSSKVGLEYLKFLGKDWGYLAFEITCVLLILGTSALGFRSRLARWALPSFFFLLSFCSMPKVPQYCPDSSYHKIERHWFWGAN
jgi:hypothetical protein